MSVANCWPARCYLRGPKRWKSLGCILPTTTMVMVVHTKGYGSPFLQSNLMPGDVHLCGPHMKRLAGQWFGTDTNMKQAVVYWLQYLTPVSSAMGYILKFWVLYCVQQADYIPFNPTIVQSTTNNHLSLSSVPCTCCGLYMAILREGSSSGIQ